MIKKQKKTHVPTLPVMHPDEYELMANYFSNDFEEQIGFLKIMADEDKEPFLPLIKDISFLSTIITDKQWATYKTRLGLTQTPRILMITSFTKTTYDLQDILAATPYLKTLKFCDKFRRRSDLIEFEKIVYPPSLESLEFDKFSAVFDKQLAYLPLKKLTFGYYSNFIFSSVVLPRTLETLTFGHDFNQDIHCNQLSACFLKTLIFGDLFDKDLFHVVLPCTLETLKFGEKFNSPLNPFQLSTTSLKTLVFGDQYNSESFSDLNLPSTLETLIFKREFNQFLRPTQLVNTSLITLIFGNNFNPFPKNFKFVVLPTSLKILDFGNTFNQKILDDQLVNTSLESLTFGSFFRNGQVGYTGASFESVILPKSLKELAIYSGLELGKEQLLNTSLTVLKYGGMSTSKFSNIKLPSTLDNLEFVRGFFDELEPCQFSNLRVKYLKFHSDYQKEILLEHLCKPDIATFSLTLSKQYKVPVLFPSTRQVSMYNGYNIQVFNLTL